MKLIGINGRYGSGKDTAVGILQAQEPRLKIARTGFADKMKLSGVRALGFDPEDVEQAVVIANIIKNHGFVSVVWHDDAGVNYEGSISGRQFWQRYGTESHRDVFGYDFWVDALLPEPGKYPSSDFSAKRLEQRFPGIDVLCITDVRFPNEAKRVLDLGGQVWQIEADKRLGPLPEDAHSSEYPLPSKYVTLTVPNNTTLEQFDTSVSVAWELSQRAE